MCFQGMESNYFFFLILPLAMLVFLLVAVVIYESRKEDDDYEKEIKKLRRLLFMGKLDRKTYINLSNRLRYVKHFNSESKKLLSLISDEKIDEGTYVRLRHILETTFRERLDKLDANTNEVCKKEPFDASKF